MARLSASDGASFASAVVLRDGPKFQLARSDWDGAEKDIGILSRWPTQWVQVT